MRFSKTCTFECIFITYPYIRRPQQTARNSKNLKIDCLLRGIHIGKKETQKINLFVVFFLQKMMKAKNCQQRKALTSHPIRLAQFHEKSFFKNTKNYVKSHVFDQASVGVTTTSFINVLETCCLKNRKKLLHSCKAANEKMSPQKPNPSHGPKLLK